MTGHSPGPWELTELACGNDGEVEPSFRIEAESTLFLTVSPCADGFQFGQNEANARLIAASPDLLEACQAFAAWDEDPHPIEADSAKLRNLVAVAIAKATGQPVAASETYPDDDPTSPRSLAERIAYENDDPSLQH